MAMGCRSIRRDSRTSRPAAGRAGLPTTPAIAHIPDAATGTRLPGRPTTGPSYLAALPLACSRSCRSLSGVPHDQKPGGVPCGYERLPSHTYAQRPGSRQRGTRRLRARGVWYPSQRGPGTQRGCRGRPPGGARGPFQGLPGGSVPPAPGGTNRLAPAAPTAPPGFSCPPLAAPAPGGRLRLGPGSFQRPPPQVVADGNPHQLRHADSHALCFGAPRLALPRRLRERSRRQPVTPDTRTAPGCCLASDGTTCAQVMHTITW